jgi:Xaa-Pro dipeptidase
LKNRVKKVFEYLEKKPDVIIVKNPSESVIDLNFFYATGLHHGLFEGCAAILFPDGNINLVVSKLESELAKSADVDILVYESREEFNIHLKNIIGNCKNVGLNYNVLSVHDFKSLNNIFPDATFLDVSSGFKIARQTKDDFEVKFIRKAADIVDKVVRKIPTIIYEGIPEYELASEINYLLQKLGADKPGFDTISSFGTNSAMPHYTHGDTKLKLGDFILCDFGANFRRYNSDITRTFVFGKANDKQKRIYETVSKAQNKGLNTIKPGLKCKNVHKAVEDFINKSEFKGHFIHSTGHSLGLGVHDTGVGFNSECEEELKENMVLTVEPGIYISGFGGVRIEDDILVTSDGAEILTKSDKKLIEIS